jgi:hypothetical protein
VGDLVEGQREVGVASGINEFQGDADIPFFWELDRDGKATYRFRAFSEKVWPMGRGGFGDTKAS